jgi:low temperature requirement protein LtrA
MAPARLLRSRGGEQLVTNVELFFDLVYVFAVTQLSHHLLAHPTVEGALRTMLLLAIVWLAWAYTMWVTNWLDPDLLAVRVMLFVQMLASLVMSIGLPEAFEQRGMLVAGAFVTMQVGRTIFVVLAVPGWELRCCRPDRRRVAYDRAHPGDHRGARPVGGRAHRPPAAPLRVI